VSRRISTLLTGMTLLVPGCEDSPEPPKARPTAARKRAAPAPVPTTAEWVPEASVLGQLAAETEVLGNPDCAIRPPVGYQLEPLDTQPGSGASGARWVSPSRPDGTVHRLLVIVGKRPLGEAAPPLGQFAADFLGSRSSQLGPLQMQPVEYGRINGLSFACVRWSAKNPDTGQQTNGFAYVATPGQADIMIDTQDVEPHQASTLKVADAAARTFRFRGAGR
jgi:hypothetical protein